MGDTLLPFVAVNEEKEDDNFSLRFGDKLLSFVAVNEENEADKLSLFFGDILFVVALLLRAIALRERPLIASEGGGGMFGKP